MSSFFDTAQSAFWILAGAIALIVLATFAVLIGIRMIGFIRSVMKDIRDGSDDSDHRRF